MDKNTAEWVKLEVGNDWEAIYYAYWIGAQRCAEVTWIPIESVEVIKGSFEKR